MTYKLLIVDDERPNVRLLERLFHDDYYCLTASSGQEAIKLLEQHEIAVIITDQRMPQMTGIELLKKSADQRPHMVRILLTGYTDLEALVEAVNCGLVYMYVSKPWKNDDLKLRVSRAVQHYEQNKQQHALSAANDRLNMRIKEMKLGFVNAMIGVLKMKDESTHSRSVRVSQCASAIGEALVLPQDALDDLRAAAALHELAALGDKEESQNQSFVGTAERCESAAEVLSCFPELRDAADVIRFHRENFDGSGSPIGLIGDQIPIAARILRVASDYDALMNPADPQTAMTRSAAIMRLRSGTGTMFDREIVQALADLSSEITASSSQTAQEQSELTTSLVN